MSSRFLPAMCLHARGVRAALRTAANMISADILADRHPRLVPSQPRIALATDCPACWQVFTGELRLRARIDGQYRMVHLNPRLLSPIMVRVH